MNRSEEPVLHRLLQRQLRKSGLQEWKNDDRLYALVQAINDSYNAYEKDKSLSEHAFHLSELEFAEMNRILKQEIQLKEDTLTLLRKTFDDISEQTQHPSVFAEKPLPEIADLLENEISKRKEVENELREARDTAESANRAKSDFLSVMSHEIRTPLNAVVGLSHILLKNDPRADQLKNLEALQTSARNLLVLVNDVLDFSKIEAKKLELENVSFNLKKMVTDLTQANLAAAGERGNEVTLDIIADIPDHVTGDPVRLGQVLNNLISNAIKFTSQGRVTIQVRLLELRDTQCELLFSVADSGIGIAEDKLESIFHPFTQASTSITRRFGGTGLGLSICQGILELMGSRLEVVSRTGKGSEFFFSLVFGRNGTGADSEEMENTNEITLAGKKILLVEDTTFNVLLATQLLEAAQAMVDVAANGAEAVEKAKAAAYDLILMDLQMPVMDGYTASREIRLFNNKVPIIALSASATTEVRQKVLAAGMNDHILKPLNPDELFPRLKKYL